MSTTVPTSKDEVLSTFLNEAREYLVPLKALFENSFIKIDEGRTERFLTAVFCCLLADSICVFDPYIRDAQKRKLAKIREELGVTEPELAIVCGRQTAIVDLLSGSIQLPTLNSCEF